MKLSLQIILFSMFIVIVAVVVVVVAVGAVVVNVVVAAVVVVVVVVAVVVTVVLVVVVVVAVVVVVVVVVTVVLVVVVAVVAALIVVVVLCLLCCCFMYNILYCSLLQSQEDHQETKEVCKRVQMVLNEEKTALQTKLSNEMRYKKEIQERKEQLEARLNIQISSLNENLNAAQAFAIESEKKAEEQRNKLVEEVKKSDALRGEIAAQAFAIESEKKAEEQRNKLVEEVKKSDALRGEIAVLEATVQNNIDERRKLLERCVTSEENVEKMKKEINLGKKKLEESQAAMMELTQENQNLQIVNNQMSTRRWEVDEDVTNCNSCDKSFSFAVRKVMTMMVLQIMI
ncbi:Early endosome antigen 1 [Exaiptasia diaphana]|nr:Early endosome antigen 1 [Exaiptasia diaphana]